MIPRGRTNERVAYCLGVYCPDIEDIIQRCEIRSGGMIRYRKKAFANVEWPDVPEKDPDYDRPTFEFWYGLDKDEPPNACFRHTRNQFVKRPFLNDATVLRMIDHVVVAVQHNLTISEALTIRGWRNTPSKDIDWAECDSIRKQIEQTTRSCSYGLLDSRVDWKHLAACAIYDL